MWPFSNKKKQQQNQLNSKACGRTLLVLLADFPTKGLNSEQAEAELKQKISVFYNEAKRKYHFIDFTFEKVIFFEEEPGQCHLKFYVPQSEDVLNLHKLLGELWHEIVWSDNS